MRAAILTIGTEITDGQIIDRNSAWIAQRLMDHRIRCVLHMSVPDDPGRISEGLCRVEKDADLIFVSGGLGPTSDDITRNAISDHYQLPLKMDVPSWESIQQKLSRRFVDIRDGHRRQSLIPQGATALENSYGVAPGIFLKTQTKWLWVLPGPPSEVESIWRDHVEPYLRKEFSVAQTQHLKTWLCLGIPESDLAARTEEYFQQFSFSKTFGYRLEMPYVEIKVWYDDDGSAEALGSFPEFTRRLGDAYVAERSKDVYQKLVQVFAEHSPIRICDRFSQGLFLKKLSDIFGPEGLQQINLDYHLNGPGPMSVSKEGLMLQMSGDTQTLQVEVVRNGEIQQKVFRTPSVRKTALNQLYLLEKLIIELARFAR